jgi:hypothetical protein
MHARLVELTSQIDEDDPVSSEGRFEREDAIAGHR